MMVGTFNGWSFEQSPLVFKYVETTAVGDVYTASTTSIYGDWKIVKDHSWTDALGGAGTNMEVGNEYNLNKGGANSGFANGYVVRNATFTLTVFDTGNAKIKVEGTAGEEHSYGVVGNFQGWNAASAPLMEEKSDGSFYIEIDNFPGAQEFKISIDKSWTCFLAQNGKTTLTFGEAYTCARDDNDNNFTVGESGQTYKVGMTLVVASDAKSAQLTVANLSESGPVEPTETYTCTFVNGPQWEKVYAYTYSPELNGAWPGIELAKSGTTTINDIEYDVYTYTVESATAPGMIIFNKGEGGDGNQTGNLEFVNGKQYEDMVPALTHTYTVVGGSAELFGETWNPEYTANDMTLSSDDQTYTWTKEGVELEAGTIQYKVAQDHAWSVSYPNSGNSTKAIDQAGIYNVTITLNPSTDTEPTMTATLVGKVITIGEYGYATYCGNLDLDFSNTTGLQAFAVTDVADGVMMLTEYDGGVKAGEAAILKGDEGTYQVPVAASEPASIDGNMLIGNSTSAAIEVTADNTTYRFGYSPLAGKVGFMKATSNFTVGAGKAYLKVGMAAAPEFIGFDGTATGIDTANVSTEDVKGERYNLNGQRVNASYRGVVIMSGKKYIQK